MYLLVIQIIKYILLIGIFVLSTAIGMSIAKAYENRVIELKEFKNMLNILKTKRLACDLILTDGASCNHCLYLIILYGIALPCRANCCITNYPYLILMALIITTLGIDGEQQLIC